MSDLIREMTEFRQQVLERFPHSTLYQLKEEEISEVLAQLEELPEDYLDFLRYVGYGSIRANHHGIYSFLIISPPPPIVENAFGDDNVFDVFDTDSGARHCYRKCEGKWQLGWDQGCGDWYPLPLEFYDQIKLEVEHAWMLEQRLKQMTEASPEQPAQSEATVKPVPKSRKPLSSGDCAIDISLRLTCEEGPMPRTSLLFRDLTAPKPSAAGKARHGKVWTLNLNERQLSLIDDRGETVLVTPSTAAEKAIRIPFRRLDPEKIVNLGIADGQGDYYWFKPEPATIKQIKQYVNLSILLQGPVAYAEMKGDAWGSFIAGCVALPTSIAVAAGVAWLFLRLTQWLPGGAVAVIGVGIVGVGASMFCVGIRDLLRFRELSRLRARLDQRATR